MKTLNLIALTCCTALAASAATNDTAVATNALPTAPATPLREANVDEIDLEELEDSAEAAKRPKVTADVAKSGPVSFVDIDCDDATLADILRQFRKTTGANIISGESTNLARRVSVTLRHVPWRDALQAMLNTRGFRLEERGDIYFVSEDMQAEPIVTRPFTLNHASCDDLAKLFNENYGIKDKAGKIIQRIATPFPAANVIVVTATEKTIRDCETIIKSVDKAMAQIYIEARFLELSSEALHKLGVDWSSLQSWSVSAKNMSVGWEKNYGRAAGYGENVTTRSLTKSTTTSQSSSANASSDGTSSTSASTSPSSSQSESATHAGLVPTGIGAAERAGLGASDMAWSDAYGFAGQLSASDFKLALSAFEQMGEGKVFSNPRVIVSNGKEARVDMTRKYPNVKISSSYTGTSSQNLSISTELETIPGEDKLMFAKEAFFSWGIQLTVTPRISPDGIISVQIVPTISSLSDYLTVNSAQSTETPYTKYPIIDVERIITEFSMKDGATAVIGGLTQTTEDDVDSGIPYLRKLPWIGPKLFGWKSREKVQKEIIVCVTVGIADPANLPEDIGLPKNAVMGREYVEGRKLEPGDRTGPAAKVLQLDTRTLDEQRESVAPAQAKPGTIVITPSKEA